MTDWMILNIVAAVVGALSVFADVTMRQGRR